MGNYNPSVPIILGQEWVPIRDEDQTFAPSVNNLEVGHGFTLAGVRQVRDARFYIHDLPANPAQLQTAMFGIYPAGTEELTGPIRQVIIPVSFGAVTGANISASGGNVASAVAKPGDFLSVTANFNGALQQELQMFFDVNRYIELANKRILNVSFLYSGYIVRFNSTTSLFEPFVDDDAGVTPPTLFSITNNGATQIQFYETQFASNTGALKLNTAINPTTGDPYADQEIQVLNLGDVNPFWSVALGPNGTNDRMPWRFTDLQRFESGAANRLQAHVSFQVPFSSDSIVLEYAAMRVIYCEEQRVVYGGHKFNYAQPQMQSITLRDLSHNADPILAAGNYTMTLSVVNPGDISFGQGVSTAFPNVNALRELYDIPPHPGIQVDIPFPLADHLGETFNAEQTHILPHLSLHASGGTLTEPHVYGRQAAAQVYGTKTATQEIYDDIVGVATSYPQVRWMARRFGADSGTLTLAGTGSLSGSTVSITSTEFDALPSVIDGWKAVTLRFAAPPAMGALASPEPSWTWSAALATAGSRWEILAASAPAISGIPGNLYNLVPAPNQLGAATYQPPAGSTVELTWMPQGVASTWVTGSTADAATDAFLIFSQDPPTITGIGVTQLTQVVTGIGLDCGSIPCCIPTGIGYNRVTWSPPAGNVVLLDTFSRTVTGWGTDDSGQTYTDTGGTVPANYPVNGSTGSHILDGVANVIRASTIAGSYTDTHQRVKISYNVASAGASYRGAIIGHYVDANNYDYVDLRAATSGTMELVISRLVAGVATGITNVPVGAFVAGQQWYLDVDFSPGGTIRAKAWPVNGTEPTAYQAETAATFTVGGVGLRSIRSTGNTNTDAVISYDDYTVGPSTYLFGAYELQRWDSVTDWQTIMLSSSPAVTGFSDFEARVGLASVYRIRATNLYDFAGAWSVQVTGTVASPGVQGCNVDGGILIFTTNDDQTGASNLAYSPGWETSGAEETFDFPEADEVILQRMYNRDGVVAFHGTERGLEHFARLLVVQQAAIDPIRLANLRSLRDLAWADHPYVCVRDDIGDRWFASVRVPAERVHQRALYMATVDIREATRTAAPVDPAS